MMTMTLERWNVSNRRRSSAGAVTCRRKFLRFPPLGFQDETYLAWERNYKWTVCKDWCIPRGFHVPLPDRGPTMDVVTRSISAIGELASIGDSIELSQD